MIPRFSVVLASVLTTGLLLGSLNLQAAPWYRVEVILVAYQNPELIGDEQWPAAIAVPLSEARAPDFRWWHTPPVNGYNALLAGFGFGRIPVANWDLPLQPPLPNPAAAGRSRTAAETSGYAGNLASGLGRTHSGTGTGCGASAGHPPDR